MTTETSVVRCESHAPAVTHQSTRRATNPRTPNKAEPSFPGRRTCTARRSPLSPTGVPTMLRKLNDKQHRCLDRVAERDARAVVIGWCPIDVGPIVLTADGTCKVARPTGYLATQR